MHESVKNIVEAFERDPALGNLHALHEADHPVWMLDRLTTFRQWLGVPGARDTRRPSIEFLDVLLGHGREAAVKLFREYELAVGPREALPVLRAIGQLARYARMQKAIAWDLDNVRPDDGRGRLRRPL